MKTFLYLVSDQIHLVNLKTTTNIFANSFKFGNFLFINENLFEALILKNVERS